MPSCLERPDHGVAQPERDRLLHVGETVDLDPQLVDHRLELGVAGTEGAGLGDGTDGGVTGAPELELELGGSGW